MALKLADFLPGLKQNAAVDFPADMTIGGSAVVALGTVTSASATAVAVGLAGATNPSFVVDSSTASQAAGLKVTGAIAAGTVALASISSGAAAGLSLDAKGTGQVSVGGTSTGLVILGAGGDDVPIISTTTTNLAAQSGTAAIAELLGGIYTHASTTGAGTLTTPTGTQMSAGIAGISTGYTFTTVYYNSGNQTVTITAGASGMTILGTAAVPTLKCAILTFVNTAANTWLCYVNLSA